MSDEWELIYRKRNSEGHSDLDKVYSWDGGRYVFEWWARDWDAQRYLFDLLDTRDNVPERLSEKAGDLFDYQNCIDVGYPAPFSDIRGLKAWADNYENERGY